MKREAFANGGYLVEQFVEKKKRKKGELSVGLSNVHDCRCSRGNCLKYLSGVSFSLFLFTVIPWKGREIPEFGTCCNFRKKAVPISLGTSCRHFCVE